MSVFEHENQDKPPRKLILPPGMTLDALLAEPEDAPLPSLAGFDRLYLRDDDFNLRRLTTWADSQATVNVILKYHGASGLNRVLKGIAHACAVHGVTMPGRIRSIAAFYEYPIF